MSEYFEECGCIHCEDITSPLGKLLCDRVSSALYIVNVIHDYHV